MDNIKTVSARDATYMSHLEELNSQRQKIEWWLPGAERSKNGELLLSGYRAQVLQDEKSSAYGWWEWLHNNVNVLDSTECI